MANLKKNQMANIIFPIVDATDFATIESGITASDFNSGMTGKFFGVTHGNSTAFTSGTISKAATLVRSGIIQQTLKATETNYDWLLIHYTGHASLADVNLVFQTVTYDDSDIYSLISDVDSQVLLNASMISDVDSQLVIADSRILVIQSLVSDVDSQVNLLATSNYLSQVHSDLTSQIGDIGTGTVTASDISDIVSGVWAGSYSILGAGASTFGSLLWTTMSKSQFSDIMSNIDAVTASVSASDISDIASAVWADTIGARVDSRIVLIQSNVSDVESQLDLTASLVSDIDSQLTVTHSLLSDVESAIDALPSSSDIASNVWNDVLTGARYNTANSAGRRLRFLQESGSYDGAIWIDTINGAAGTTSFENGTDTNPVDTIADANTLATALGITRFKIAPGSSITFAAAQSGQWFEGANWTLALGGQNIANSQFFGATVSGTGTGSGTEFHHCQMGAVTLADCTLVGCAFTNTITASAAGDYYFDQCYSGIAGTSTPTFDFGALVANTGVNIRHYSGGIEIQNMGATGTDNMSLEGNGQLVINANCAGGTVAIRGNFSVTDNAGGALTLSDAARFATDQSLLLTASTMSDIASRVDVVLTSDLSDILSAAQQANSRALVIESMVSDVESQLDLTASVVSDIDSQLLVTHSLLSDVESAIDAGVTVTASSISDIASRVLTTALTEDYAADGSTFTLAQALYMIWSNTAEFAISGTTLTVKKLDGSTTAMTFTLDDATNPTSRTRAT